VQRGHGHVLLAQVGIDRGLPRYRSGEFLHCHCVYRHHPAAGFVNTEKFQLEPLVFRPVFKDQLAELFNCPLGQQSDPHLLGHVAAPVVFASRVGVPRFDETACSVFAVCAVGVCWAPNGAAATRADTASFRTRRAHCTDGMTSEDVHRVQWGIAGNFKIRCFCTAATPTFGTSLFSAVFPEL
jgi:hypothetical protein